MTLSYQAYRAHRYSIGWSENLAPGSWSPLSVDTDPVETDGPRSVEDHGTANVPVRFYRYQVLD